MFREYWITEKEFIDNVIEPFVCSYERGETPNPCIRCNKYLKFDILYEKAKSLGYDNIVTGHYARIKEKDGHFYLLKAEDQGKDQSAESETDCFRIRITEDQL